MSSGEVDAVVQLRRWDEEAAAGALILEVLGGKWRKRDGYRMPDRTYDLDVWTAKNVHLAVEVTQEIDSELRKQYAAETKADLTFAQLDNSWTVSVRGPLRIKQIRERLLPLLQNLERAGMRKIYISAGGPHTAQEQPLADLGIAYAVGQASGSPGEIRFSTAGPIGSGSAAVIARTALDHANRADNIAKLELASDANERHLFIWVDTTVPHVSIPLSMGLTPTEVIVLPVSIDVIWMASARTNPKLLRFDRSIGWQFVKGSPFTGDS